MKILIIGFTKLKYMPYINFYLENIDRSKNDVHLLYWNRDLKQEDLSSVSDLTLYEFKYKQEDDVSKLSKIGSFLNFRKFVLSVLNINKFDLVIVLHSLPAVLIYDKLLKNYGGKYILDYRDSTYEKVSVFKKIIGNIVKKSYATFVSSDAFRHLLPLKCKKKIYTSHNILIDSLKHRNEKEKRGISSDKIRIGFWGIIRNLNLNKVIIKKVSFDKRFELHYYGREQQVALDLKEYANTIGAENVFFHGEYVPEQRYNFICQTDIIHNIYGDNNMKLAMANKYYDGIVFKLPQLCIKNSYMGKRVSFYNIGLECDPYCDEFLDNIYQYYTTINLVEFNNACDNELNDVLNQYKKGVQVIETAVNEE